MKKYFVLIFFLLTHISTTYGMWMDRETSWAEEIRRAARTKDPLRYYVSTEIPKNDKQEELEKEEKNMILDSIEREEKVCTCCRIATAATVVTVMCTIVTAVVLLTNIYR